jgi:transcriptional regulator
VNGTEGWKMGDAPPAFLDTMLENIVACHLRVTRLEAKSKLNQNRSATDIGAVAEAFEAQGNSALAAAMRSRLPKG